jgi:hypothetical protein
MLLQNPLAKNPMMMLTNVSLKPLLPLVKVVPKKR